MSDFDPQETPQEFINRFKSISWELTALFERAGKYAPHIEIHTGQARFLSQFTLDHMADDPPDEDTC